MSDYASADTYAMASVLFPESDELGQLYREHFISHMTGECGCPVDSSMDPKVAAILEQMQEIREGEDYLRKLIIYATEVSPKPLGENEIHALTGLRGRRLKSFLGSSHIWHQVLEGLRKALVQDKEGDLPFELVDNIKKLDDKVRTRG